MHCNSPGQFLAIPRGPMPARWPFPRSAPKLIPVLVISLALATEPARAETELPPTVDLTGDQTAICNQGHRDTCIYHPQVAALEAAYRRAGTPVELSVEHLVWLRNVTALGGKVADPDLNEDGLANLGGGSMLHGFHLLSRYGISRARDMPYRPDYEDTRTAYFRGFDVTDFRWWEPFRQISLNRFNLDPRQYPPAAGQHARYGIKEYIVFSEKDRRNPRKIEEALASGHEVAVNLFISFRPGTADKGRGNVPGLVWYRAKDAVPVGLSHALLLVGYDRARQVFIAKNSWGPNLNGFAQLPRGWKDLARYRGFTLIHYNYLLGCREAGYITRVVDPADDPFPRSRALGLWQVTFQQRSTKRRLGSAVLAWRRLPGTDEAVKADLRIGDLYWAGGQYRVNARLQGTDPLAATLYVNLDRPQTAFDDEGGVQLDGTLSLPTTGPGAFQVTRVVAPRGVKYLFGVPADDLACAAVQQTAHNPLLKIPTPNMLTNGSFEEGPPVGDYLPLDKGSTALPGWTVTRGQIDYLGSHWRADHGQHSLDLHGSPGYGGVAQTFRTVPGQRYRTTFALAGSPGSNPAVKRVAVAAAGRRQDFEFDSTGKSIQAMGWTTKTWEFEANAAETTLEIFSLETTDPYAGPALDNVRVVSVPGR
jgi:choice-of-anchor C domain-containing protein